MINTLKSILLALAIILASTGGVLAYERLVSVYRSSAVSIAEQAMLLYQTPDNKNIVLKIVDKENQATCYLAIMEYKYNAATGISCIK